MISSTSFYNHTINLSQFIFVFRRIPTFWKMVSLPVVLLIFISSNDPLGKLKERIGETSTSEPEKGFVDSGKNVKALRPQVNDLTAVDFKFPDDNPKGPNLENKKFIVEKIVPDDKNEANKTPIPLYSLVKNDCGEGYALDENGVCQKTIAVRSGKKLDLDRRRKRHVSNDDWLIRKKRRSVPEHPLPYRKTSEKFLRNGFRSLPVDCNKLYPGVLPEEVGGCKNLEAVPKH